MIAGMPGRSLSHVRLPVTPWTVIRRAPLSLELNSPGKNVGVGGHAFLQGIFPTHRSNPSSGRQVIHYEHHLGSRKTNVRSMEKPLKR